MASKKPGKDQILANFFDDGVYSVLFAQGGVTAAYGTANGQPVYAVAQAGGAVTVKDLQKNSKVLDLAAQTGNPVVTFYDSTGAVLEEGLDLLAAYAQLTEKIARLSGVVPQIAVVTGVCAGSAALCAAGADLCIMAQDGELFFTPPFTSAAAGDACAQAGSGELAAKAGVVSCLAKDALEAASLAAHLVGLLPSNNLASPSVFEFEAPAQVYAGGDPLKAAGSLLDQDSMIQLYSGFGKKALTALGTLNGNTVGLVIPGEKICHNCASKIARFVRFCDAYSIPVVTLVNTQGFKASTTEDVSGGVREAARLMATYGDATTVRVTVLAGQAVGPVYMSLAQGDFRLAVEGCVVSSVDPKVAVSVLEKDALDSSANIQSAIDAAARTYAQEKCGAQAAVEAGLADLACDAAALRDTLAFTLDMLATKRGSRLPKKHGNMPL